MSDDKYVLNAEYTGISLAYKNPSYIADKVPVSYTHLTLPTILRV